jgi:hypothetical protein
MIWEREARRYNRANSAFPNSGQSLVYKQEIVLNLLRTMSARYGTLHWIRVVLWPLPVLTLLKAGRAAMKAMRRWASANAA